MSKREVGNGRIEGCRYEQSDCYIRTAVQAECDERLLVFVPKAYVGHEWKEHDQGQGNVLQWRGVPIDCNDPNEACSLKRQDVRHPAIIRNAVEDECLRRHRRVRDGATENVEAQVVFTAKDCHAKRNK